jgi:mRNA interferase RelE/StbE
VQVTLLKSFKKDLGKVPELIRHRVPEVICACEQAKSVRELPGIKKLKGNTHAYRIRIGDYRVGIFVGVSRVVFVAISNRKDFYKHFP